MPFNDYETLQQNITDLYQQINCIKNGDCCGVKFKTPNFTLSGNTLTTLFVDGTSKDVDLSSIISAGSQNLYNLSATVGAGRVATLTDTLTFAGSSATRKLVLGVLGTIQSKVDGTSQAWTYEAINSPKGLFLSNNGGLETATFINTLGTNTNSNGVASYLGVPPSSNNSTILYTSGVPTYSASSASLRGVNKIVNSSPLHTMAGVAGHSINSNILGNSTGVYGSSGLGQGEISPWAKVSGSISAGVHGSWTRQTIVNNARATKNNFGGLFEMYAGGNFAVEAPELIAVRGHCEAGVGNALRVGAKFTSKKYGGAVKDLRNATTQYDIALLVPGLTQGNWGNVVFGADTRRPNSGVGNIPSTVEITGDLEFRNATSGTVFTRPDGVRVQVLLDNTDTFIFNTLT